MFEPGMAYAVLIEITESDVEDFGRIVGDYNPVHFSEEYAKQSTLFGRRIAHGMLLGGLISGALSMWPGPGTIYQSQTLEFKAPVFFGDKVEVKVALKELLPKNGAIFVTTVTKLDGTQVVTGEAKVKLPR